MKATKAWAVVNSDGEIQWWLNGAVDRKRTDVEPFMMWNLGLKIVRVEITPVNPKKRGRK